MEKQQYRRASERNVVPGAGATSALKAMRVEFKLLEPA